MYTTSTLQQNKKCAGTKTTPATLLLSNALAVECICWLRTPEKYFSYLERTIRFLQRSYDYLQRKCTLLLRIKDAKESMYEQKRIA